MYGIYFERSYRAVGTRRVPLRRPRRYWLTHGHGSVSPWSARPDRARRFDSRREAEEAVKAELDPRWADEPTLVGKLPGGNGR